MRAPPKAARRELRGGAGAEDMVGRRWCSEREEGGGRREKGRGERMTGSALCTVVDSDSVALRTALQHRTHSSQTQLTPHCTTPPHTSPQRNITPF